MKQLINLKNYIKRLINMPKHYYADDLERETSIDSKAAIGIIIILAGILLPIVYLINYIRRIKLVWK